MKPDVRKTRNKLLVDSKQLRELACKMDNHAKSCEAREKQNEMYKKWVFYDQLLKADCKGDSQCKKN